MAHADPASAKAALRLALQSQRKGLAREAPDAGARAADSAPLERFGGHATIAGYLARGSEIDPEPLMRRFGAAGARLALPVALTPGGPLAFRAYQIGDPLSPDACGVPAPSDGAALLRPDLVIVPLLAFDRRGGRMGRGGGHYDRTLAKLRAEGAVFALGLAYAGQAVAQVPCEPHDQRLDAILTEKGYIEVR